LKREGRGQGEQGVLKDQEKKSKRVEAGELERRKKKRRVTRKRRKWK
jgi:hypothetical protein